MSDRLKILVIHGPNLNLLGKRDPTRYGSITMNEINRELKKIADKLDVEVSFFQSNHEGGIIDFLQEEASRKSDGVLVNPGALIRYAYCFRQALVDLAKPVMEIHMSDIDKTGVRKNVNVLDDVRTKRITGMKERSYYEGFEQLVEYIKRNK